MTAPTAGDVWLYEFLWEYARRMDHGRKPRPTAVVAALKGKDGRTNVFILPITSKKPESDRDSIAIPEIERRRAGLEEEIELWVMIDEYNHEFLETTYHLDPNGKIGTLSPIFLAKVLGAFRTLAKAGRAKRIPRG